MLLFTLYPHLDHNLHQMGDAQGRGSHPQTRIHEESPAGQKITIHTTAKEIIQYNKYHICRCPTLF